MAASKCLQFVNMKLPRVEDAFDGKGRVHVGGSPTHAQPEITESDCLGYKVKHYRNLIMGAIKL